MVSLKPIMQGEEIFNDYGQLPRSDLLRRYGYVTDHYKLWDVVEIEADLIIRIISEGHTDELNRRSRVNET
jgi:SET domain-containing protein 6